VLRVEMGLVLMLEVVHYTERVHAVLMMLMLIERLLLLLLRRMNKRVWVCHVTPMC